MTEILDEALQRLRRTGPEHDGWLSNHGPMAVEALVHRGHGDAVHRWLDTYERRLEEHPARHRAHRGGRMARTARRPVPHG